ncbi:multidrug transporter [Desulfuromonas versatilis]|uniref:Multidrug transporter n=1 Tax=Desulfuromonas versatilis TaxID=2802975 RepID=A0ABN6E1Q8_9BACT|nr:signal peptide peptidase SppA [Desulfuromonas versatilis]BCR05419.1 multidrug transporter [Desulfuromonas versatilis]
MKKRPFLMAFLTLGAIFLFFLALVYAVSGLSGPSRSFPIGEKIGVIEIAGVITASKTINEQLVNFREDSSVKAIVLRIDSPGGGVGPSQEIYEEVRKANEIKPVVASMGSVAASGGYYVAAPARSILANPGTITGSIGVIMEFTNFQELLEKIGLKSQVVKSGEHKDIGSPVRPMSEADRAILQSLIDDVHAQFVSAVAEGRQMTTEEVAPLADGRIFTGRQALEQGLVDELGNLQDAIDVAARMAGIEGEPRVIYPAEKKPKIFDYLIEETASQLQRGLQERGGAGPQFLWSGVK